MREKRIDLSGRPFTYFSGGDGPLVVMAHALGRTAWGNLAQLQERCTVAVPGWDATDLLPTPDYSWYERILEAEQQQSAALCAWSMAGPAALMYATENPARIAHLVLNDVAGLGGSLPPLKMKDFPHLVLSKLRGYPTRGFVKAMWRGWVRSESLDTTSLEDATYRFFQKRSASGMGRSVTDGDLMASLPRLEMPVLILTGRHSTVLGPQHAAVASVQIRNCKFVVFEESAHAPQLEEPQKFQEMVGEFLTEG